MLKEYFSRLTESKYLFYFVLIINFVFLWFTRFYPSMDGPTHLYNSNILLHIIKGNKFLSEYYAINNLPIPNWTSHFIILIFHSFLPSWLAEKIFLMLYVAGMALSFRYLIKILNPQNLSLSILIFPFIYSFLFHLGFYNFCLSFALFFYSLGFWLHIHNSKNIYNHIVLFLLITITYFTNFILFVFLGLTIGLFILYFSYIEYLNIKKISCIIKSCCKKLFLLFLISLPCIIFSIIFFAHIKFYPSEEVYSIKEMIKWINDARPFIVYNYAKEEIITEQFFHVLLLILGFSYILINKNNNFNNQKEKANIILIPLILSLFLFFITPNGSNAGMMSDRYCLILYIFALIWIIARSVISKINGIIILSSLILHFYLLFMHLNDATRILDANAINIYKTEKYISENSIILPINFSDNWLEPHFSNYIGIEKPVVILENYEASVGWFPLKWKSDNLPKIQLNSKNKISGIQWLTNLNAKSTKQIDYILIYGNLKLIDTPKWTELKKELITGYKLKYKSSNNYILLYEKL